MSKKFKREPTPYEIHKDSLPKIFKKTERMNSQRFFKSDYKSKQKGALEYSVNNFLLPMWAIDIARKEYEGKKMYMCCSYSYMFDIIKKKYKENKYNGNVYELLMVNMPLHFYVDSEIYVTLNPNVDVEEIHSRFINHVTKFFISKNWATASNPIEIKILDASTPEKFSRHYIFKMPDGKLFKDLYHCGSVAYWLKQFIIDNDDKYMDFFFKMPLKKSKDPNAAQETLERSDGFIVDEGVYTQNRAIRAPLQVKYRKSNILMYFDKNCDLDDFDTFVSYLIQSDATYEDSKIVECFYPGNIEPNQRMNLLDFSKASNFQIETEKNRTALKTFYEKSFPFSFIWNKFGHPDREFSFEFAKRGTEGTWFSQRFFNSESDFQMNVLASIPEIIHIGAIKTPEPNRSYLKRELVFDVDLKDYHFRKCCGAKSVCCKKCWPLMTFAFHVLKMRLCDHWGFKDYLMVFSGAKGGHFWVFKDADEFTSSARKGIVSEIDRSSIKQGSPLLYQVSRDGTWRKIYEELVKSDVINPIDNEMEQILLIWPRLDDQVTIQNAHKVKSPCVKHLKTKRTCCIITDYLKYNPFL